MRTGALGDIAIGCQSAVEPSQSECPNFALSLPFGGQSRRPICTAAIESCLLGEKCDGTAPEAPRLPLADCAWEAAMKPLIDRRCIGLRALVAAIEHSPITVKGDKAPLPPRYDAVDATILEWIAEEGRVIGRGFLLM
jgi:hypothetical protein